MEEEKGWVILNVEFPLMNVLHDFINKEDLYPDIEWAEGGLETEPHITLLGGVDPNVSTEDVKGILDDFTFSKILIEEVSIFENEDYDVLKFKATSSLLEEVNENLKKLNHKSPYPEFNPHVTIAYLQKGKGEMYSKIFQKLKFEIKPVEVNFSFNPENKDSIDIKKNLE